MYNYEDVLNKPINNVTLEDKLEIAKSCKFYRNYEYYDLCVIGADPMLDCILCKAYTRKE